MPKKITPLTELQVRKSKAASKQFTLFDGGGLFLLVTPSGGKLWRFKYRHAGKENMLSFGSYPEVSLADARDSRTEAKRLLLQGIDPSQSRKNTKALQKEVAKNTLEAVTREWHLKFSSAGKWSEGHATDILHRFEKDIFPPLGARPISEIKPVDLLKVLERVASRGALDTAHRLKHHCGMVFRYAVVTERAERDIAADLRGALPSVKNGHHAALTTPKTLAPLLVAVDEYEGSFPVKCALQLLPMFFCRPGELRAAEWAEFDLENAVWEIPAGRMKMKQPHIVPLSHQAIEVLKALQPLTGGGRYLFPSTRSVLRCISDNTLNAALRRLGFTKEEATAHGFRASARTILDEVLKFRPEYIEHQLSHTVRDALGTAYNRTTHLEARRDMMQRWADFLDDIKKLAKPTPISEVA
ncbi:Integrase [Citrifermentans bremense]|uniref:Integrase n=1 Tax=Citrifermentans bremense TaxID=60035 RepID=A0A6S6LXV2_9BACT|nr:integrase arm-type DNA-binding domain-containing protein [Citrifermentans bremense]BCG45660.1 Integrase [Citrifermentans bremense]